MRFDRPRRTQGVQTRTTTTNTLHHACSACSWAFMAATSAPVIGSTSWAGRASAAACSQGRAGKGRQVGWELLLETAFIRAGEGQHIRLLTSDTPAAAAPAAAVVPGEGCACTRAAPAPCSGTCGSCGCASGDRGNSLASVGGRGSSAATLGVGGAGGPAGRGSSSGSSSAVAPPAGCRGAKLSATSHLCLGF